MESKFNGLVSFLLVQSRGFRAELGSNPIAPMWRKRLIQRDMPCRFKTCRLLPGNVRKRELTIIQRRILRKLRNKKRSIKKKIDSGITMHRLPLFVWSVLVTAFLLLLSLPVLKNSGIGLQALFQEFDPTGLVPLTHYQYIMNYSSLVLLLRSKPYLILVIFTILFLIKIFYDLKKQNLGDRDRRTSFGCFFLFFLFIFSKGFTIAMCDATPSSPTMNPEEWIGIGEEQELALPEPVPPAPEPVPVPPAPVIPILPQPLLPDQIRTAELFSSLNIHFIGKNSTSQLNEFYLILEKQMYLEKFIEAALVDDGFHPERIYQKRPQLREIAFYHPHRNLPLSSHTLQSYIDELFSVGTRSTKPYQRIHKAIQNYDIFLNRP